MASAAVWLEGAHHPFEDQAKWFAEFLPTLGLQPTFPSASNLLSAEGESSDLWIMGGLVYSGMGESYQPLSEEAAEALKERVKQGRPLLALHSVIGSWDDRPELDEVWDGRWDWDHSKHSPVEPFPVKVSEPSHPLCQGLDSFTITDELYYSLRPPRASKVVLQAEYQGQDWPLAWCRNRMVYFGLGHDLRSLENPHYGAFIKNAASYLLN